MVELQIQSWLDDYWSNFEYLKSKHENVKDSASLNFRIEFTPYNSINDVLMKYLNTDRKAQNTLTMRYYEKSLFQLVWYILTYGLDTEIFKCNLVKCDKWILVANALLVYEATGIKL